jgi:pyridinium-3,5-bisthiocarboxylic acid mononucleotide nickel chelatase
MNPEIFGFLMERLLEAGALDVAFSPLQMKKNRPGTRLTVIAGKRDLEKLSGVILGESTAIGLRYYPVRRITLARSVEVRETSLGPVQVKLLEGGRVSPEFDSCRAIAIARGLPLVEVYRIVERETWKA